MAKASESIKERIRAMLVLAENEGATEAEAATALSKATELLLKYNLERDEVLGAGGESIRDDELVHENLTQTTAGFQQRWLLLLELAKSNLVSTVGTEYVDDRGIIHLLGRRGNVEAVMEMERFVLAQLTPLAFTALKDYFHPPQQSAWLFDDTGDSRQSEWTPRGTEDEREFKSGFMSAATKRIGLRLSVGIDAFMIDPTGKALVVASTLEVGEFKEREFPGGLGYARFNRVAGRDGRKAGDRAAKGIRFAQDPSLAGGGGRLQLR